MNVVITKSLLDAPDTMSKLVRMQHEVVSFPLLNIHALEDPKWDSVRNREGGYGAVLFTSRYAVLGFSRLIREKRDLHYLYKVPVYTVGGKTRMCAIQSGFESVAGAESTAQDLAFSLSRRQSGEQEPFLYVSGREMAFDFETFFEMAGISFEHIVVYESVGAQRIPRNILEKFSTSWVDAVLFYSSKGAETFVRLAHKHGLTLSHVRAYCLSKAICNRLRVLQFRSYETAFRPSEETLLRMLGSARNERLPGT